jgi:copper chaperone CopZ
MIDRRRTTNDELFLASHDLGKGLRQSALSVPTIHCGGCIQKIETTLDALPGVEQARVNLSAKRVTILWRADGTPPPLIESLRRLGYEAHLYDADADTKDGTVAQLVRALAVAGFAASNIMLLSVSIWSGAEPATRNLFHWISALIALPAVAYLRTHFLRLCLAKPAPWPDQHGRSNFHRSPARLRSELIRDVHPRATCLFRRINHSSVFPADWTHARSHDAGKGTSRR